MKVIIITPL